VGKFDFFQKIKTKIQWYLAAYKET